MVTKWILGLSDLVVWKWYRYLIVEYVKTQIFDGDGNVLVGILCGPRFLRCRI